MRTRSRPTLALGTAGLLALLGTVWLVRGPARSTVLVATAAAEPESTRHAQGDRLPALERETVRPVAAARSRLSSAPAVEPQAGAACALSGRVLDQAGVTVPAVRVRLHGDREKQAAVTDGRGRYRFDRLIPGTYRLWVDGDSLPPDCLPPWRQEIPHEYDGQATGVFGTAFRVADAEPREIDLRVFVAGTVRGRVIDSDGTPLAGAQVTLRTMSGIEWNARTSMHGAFEAARAYPGDYVTCVALAPPWTTSAPLPLRFELAAAETLVLADLVAGSGGHILRGSVVDESDQPVAGLSVECREIEGAARWQTSTDEFGRYELGRVPATELVVGIGVPQRAAGRLLASVTRLQGQPTEIQTTTRGAPAELDLGCVTVSVLRLLRVRGRIEVDPHWARQNGLERWTSSIRVRALDGSPSSPVSLLRHGLDAARSESRFSWECPVTGPDVEFTVVLRGANGTEHERRALVRPAQAGADKVVVRFP